LSEIAQDVHLSRATTRRFLLTLEALGYVRSSGREFELTPRVLELGFSYLSGLGFPAIARPHLEELSRLVGESTSASVLDANDIVYVARVPTRRIMAVNITLGTRFPAHATSMGRVLLAQLSEHEVRQRFAGVRLEPFTSSTVTSVDVLVEELTAVREHGWALVDQELEYGLRSVAAPVYQRGKMLAAINISTTVGTKTLEQVREDYVPLLLATADEITADLEHTSN
jgi:IclR family pca regulon transcriptional regulator